MIVLLSLTFPCVVRTLTGSCSKTKRFELVGTGKRMLLSENLKIFKIRWMNILSYATMYRSNCMYFLSQNLAIIVGNGRIILVKTDLLFILIKFRDKCNDVFKISWPFYNLKRTFSVVRCCNYSKLRFGMTSGLKKTPKQQMKERKGVIMNFFPYLNLGFALLNHEIKRVTVVSSLDCAMECTATRECRSFSFNSNESVQGNCQLNDATQSICSPSECKKSDGLVHYEASHLVSKYYQFLCKKEMYSV